MLPSLQFRGGPCVEQFQRTGLVLQTAQTVCIALAWLAIIRYAYPDTRIPFKPVLASYAISVALNGFLPGPLGTPVLLLLFRTQPLPPFLASQQWIERLHRKDGGVPYGIALAAAALCIYPDTFWMKGVAV